MFAVMMDLLSPFENESDRDSIWITKRAKLLPVTYKVKTLGQDVTVQKGWWFSAHESWKYLFLPYLDSPINAKLFKNGEKVRTWDARESSLPGMFASVTGTIKRNED